MNSMPKSFRSNSARADESEDTPKNWITLELHFIEQDNFTVTISAMRQAIITMAKAVKSLKERMKISTWHFRWGGLVVSFRLKPAADPRDEIIAELQGVAELLIQKKLVNRRRFEDPTFIFSEKVVLEEYRSWINWNIFMKCLEYLSEIAVNVLTCEDRQFRAYLFHAKIIHHLFNMLTMQEFFRPYEIKRGEHEAISKLLTEDSSRHLNETLEGFEKKHNVKLDNFALRFILFLNSVP